MKRVAMNKLIEWKNSPKRKPLLLYGARQVGKTYLVKEFGNDQYDNIIYVNFETNKIVSNMINDDISPELIIKNLEIVFNQKIEKGRTLIFFDEIQENPRALTSLKYFCEDANDYHIIGAGSLLGVHLNKKNFSFPVGKVDFLTIYPLSFEEFLINTNNDILLNEIKECYNLNRKISETSHEKATSLYHDYLALGGMPEVVEEYINSKSLITAIDFQHTIIDSYRSDISKYSTSDQGNKIISTFDSIPIQLAKENKKFQYKVIQKGGTASIFGESINWIVNAGIALKCEKLPDNVGVPLDMYKEIDSFKLYMNDVGLLTNMSNFPIYLIQNRDAVNEIMIGMLNENYVANCLKYNSINLFYWKNNGECEVDFVAQSRKGLIIPIEVKSGTNTKSKSLNMFMNINKPKYAIRISGKNFGFVNNIKSVPLYATFCINPDSLDI